MLALQGIYEKIKCSDAVSLVNNSKFKMLIEVKINVLHVALLVSQETTYICPQP